MKQGIDYIGVTVCFYCHDGKSNLLLNKRSQNCRDEKGRWDCGGGAIKFGETWEQGVRREIKEEYGTEVIDYSFLGNREVLREQEGRRTHWISFDFKVLIDKSKVNSPHQPGGRIFGEHFHQLVHGKDNQET